MDRDRWLTLLVGCAFAWPVGAGQDGGDLPGPLGAPGSRTVHLEAGSVGPAGFAPARVIELEPSLAGPLVLRAESYEVDARLAIVGEQDELLASDDDGGIGWNARLEISGRPDGPLRIVVGAREGESGEVTLYVEEASTAVDPAGPELVERTVAFWRRSAESASSRRDPERRAYCLTQGGFTAYEAERSVAAEVLLHDAAELWRSLDRAGAAAQVDVLLGDIHVRWANAELAERHLHRALEGLRSPEVGLAGSAFEALVLENLVRVLVETGRPTEAARRAEELSQLDGNEESFRVAADLARALVHDALGEHAEADAAFARVTATADGRLRAAGLVEQARGLEDRGELRRAERVLREAADASDDPEQRSVALGRLLALHERTGDYARARATLDELQAVVSPGTDVGHAARHQLGRIQRLLGRPEAASRTLTELVDELGPAPRHTGRVRALLELALAMHDLGRADERDRRLDEALSLARSIPGARLLEAGVVTHQAGFEPDPVRARALYDRSIAVAEQNGFAEQLAVTRCDLAWLDHLVGEHERAIENAGAALEVLEPARFELPILAALDTWAASALALGRLDEARAALVRAERVLERPNVGELPPTDVALWRARHAGWSRTAQEYVTRALAVALDVERRALVEYGLRQADLWRQRGVVQAARLRREFGASRRSLPLPELPPSSVLVEYARDLEQLHAYVLSKGTPQRIALGEAAPIDALVREYVESLVGGEALEPARLVERGRRLFDLLLAPVLQGRNDVERVLVVPDGELATLPFDALVVASDASPETLENVEYVLDRYEVVLVPSLLGIEALGARPDRDVRERALVLADPAYTTRAPADATGRDAASDALLAEQLGPFERLPGTRDEAFTLARLLLDEDADKVRLFDLAGERSGSLRTRALDLHVGDEASPARLAGDLRGYTLVYVAAHGRIDAEDPRNTGLVLASPNGGPALVRVGDIVGARLDAELTVLSACGSASGRLLDGEGLQSLARAFLIAGSRGVVATLWQVDDRRTAETMRAFAERLLGEGLTPAAALREAKLEARRGSTSRGVGVGGTPDAGGAAHPASWAPFVYIGPAE